MLNLRLQFTRTFISLFIVAFTTPPMYAQNTSGADSTFTNSDGDKIMLLLSQKSVSAGDTLTIRSFCTDLQSVTLSQLSKTSTVELVDQEGHILSRQEMMLEDGTGQCKLPIPQSITIGNYILRAQSEWMQQQRPDEYFRMDLSVLGKISIVKVDYKNISWEQKYTQHYNREYEEKIYVHLNQGSILAGEKLYFKAYCTDVKTGTLSELSKIGYIEILDAEGAPVQQEKFRLEGGLGSGEINISTSVRTGFYTLRVYTRWMKNCPANNFFHTAVRVINTFNNPNLITENKNSKPSLNFYPEGGYLIADQLSKVAYMLTGPTSATYEGNIKDEFGNDVATINPGLYGLGTVTFKPENGMKYFAYIKNDEDGSFRFELPEVRNAGVTILVNNTENLIELRITSNLSFDDPLHILIHSDGKVSHYEKIMLSKESKMLTFDKNIMPFGVSNITVFLPDGTPCCERMVFKTPSTLPQLNTQSNRQNYNLRQRVTLEVANEADHSAYLSTSVYKVDQTTLHSPVDIVSYSMLSSALIGKNNDISNVFTLPESERKEVIDQILLTRGWSRYNWVEIAIGQKTDKKFVPEFRQHVLEGKLFQKDTQMPAKFKKVYLGSPGKMTRLYGDKSDEEGRIFIELADYYGEREIILQPWDDEEGGYDLELLNPFSDEKIDFNPPHLMLDNMMENDLTQRSRYMQIMNVYTPERILNIKRDQDSINFYMQPDNQYYLDDYNRFRVMEEVMREYVSGVLVRRKKEDFSFFVYDKTNDIFFDTPPLLLLDGIPVPVVNDIIAYDPLTVKRLDVVERRYFLGELEFPGIVSYFTYNGKMENYTLPTNATILVYKSIQAQREFYVPPYDTEDLSRIPDFRHQLYWNGDIKVGANGKTKLGFFTSDVPGKYIAVTEGLTEDGLPLHSVTEFEVEDSPVN